MILVIDTENNRNEKGEWVLTQLSWLTYSNEFHKTKERNIFLVKDTDVKSILKELSSDIFASQILVGHNFMFDYDVLNREFQLNSIDSDIDNKLFVDTMVESADFCKLEGKFGYKWPKLGELYEKLFNKNLEGAHDALIDAEATAKCFFVLYIKNVLVPNENLYSKLKSSQEKILEDLDSIVHQVKGYIDLLWGLFNVNGQYLLYDKIKENNSSEKYNPFSLKSRPKRELEIIQKFERIHSILKDKPNGKEIFENYSLLEALNECVIYLNDRNLINEDIKQKEMSAMASIVLKSSKDLGRSDFTNAKLYTTISDILEKQSKLQKLLPHFDLKKINTPKQGCLLNFGLLIIILITTLVFV